MSNYQPFTVSDQPQVRHTDGLWEIAEAAAYLKCSRRSVRRYVNRAERPLPHVRIAGRLLFRRAEIDAWVDSQVAA